MSARAKKKNRLPLLLKLGILVLAIYLAVVMVNMQLEIKDKQDIIDQKQAEIVKYERLNEDLKNKVDNKDLYLDQQAREHGYVDPGADVYKEIS